MNEKEDLKGNYPPKKGKIRKSKQIINNLVTENIEFINDKPKQKTRKIKSVFFTLIKYQKPRKQKKKQMW